MKIKNHHNHCLPLLLLLTALLSACSIDTPKPAMTNSPPQRTVTNDNCINPPPPKAKNSACPLAELPVSCFQSLQDQQNTINSFTDSRCEYQQLNADTTFYRHFDNVAGKKGGYYSLEEIRINDSDKDKNLHNKIIKKLALVQEWGNSAKMTETVIFPKGTVVYTGTAAPQGKNTEEKTLCYPGGAQQTFILFATQQALFNKNLVKFSDPYDVVFQKNDHRLFTCPPQ